VQVVAEKAAEDAASDSVDPEQPPVDWQITMLLFIFPALGGLLFGALFRPAHIECRRMHDLLCCECASPTALLDVTSLVTKQCAHTHLCCLGLVC